MSISFRPVDGGAALELVDGVEGRRLRVEATPPVDPEPRPTDQPFRFPVDGAVSVTASSLAVPEAATGLVRDADGAQLAELVPGTDESFPEGRYAVEFDGPMKVYLHVEGPLSATATLQRVELEFDGEREVAVGARSFHRRPAATVTTTGDPADLLRAVSTFGSALKTTSCERSYPTLRGHPPTLRLGDALSVPEAVSAPETGVRLELPPERRYAFVAAPLSYYLGADCVPGPRPRLVTDTGLERSLQDPDVETAVGRLLRRTFFLDCLARTEGHYEVPLRERRAVEPLVDLEFESLYGRPLAERLEAHLSVPYETLRPHLPRWPLTADVPPTAERATVLPYLVDDLALVRAADGERLAAPEVRSRLLDGLWDDGGGDARRRREDESPAADGGDAPAGGGGPPPVVGPPESDAMAQVWFGEGVPVGADKGVEAAYRHRLERTTGDGDVSIAVVCNGDVGREERAVEDVYGSREFPFDVTLRSGVAAGELAALLESEVDFLHYVGHIDDEGFDCPGGALDAASLERVGVHAFLLNACRSYRQGVALVERGAVGGVVTFADVVDSGAVRVGRAMARLLDRGFPLGSAFDVASGESIVGGNYLVVGDGTVEVVQPRHGAPILCDLARADGAADYELTVRAYLPSGTGMGTLAVPYVGDNDEYFLPPGRLGTFRLSESELREYLTWYDDPVRRDGQLHWPDGPDAPERLLRDRR